MHLQVIKSICKDIQEYRDLNAYDETYQTMRKQWRESENAV